MYGHGWLCHTANLLLWMYGDDTAFLPHIYVRRVCILEKIHCAGATFEIHQTAGSSIAESETRRLHGCLLRLVGSWLRSDGLAVCLSVCLSGCLSSESINISRGTTEKEKTTKAKIDVHDPTCSQIPCAWVWGLHQRPQPIAEVIHARLGCISSPGHK